MDRKTGLHISLTEATRLAIETEVAYRRTHGEIGLSISQFLEDAVSAQLKTIWADRHESRTLKKTTAKPKPAQVELPPEPIGGPERKQHWDPELKALLQG